MLLLVKTRDMFLNGHYYTVDAIENVIPFSLNYPGQPCIRDPDGYRVDARPSCRKMLNCIMALPICSYIVRLLFHTASGCEATVADANPLSDTALERLLQSLIEENTLAEKDAALKIQGVCGDREYIVQSNMGRPYRLQAHDDGRCKF